MNVVSFPRLSLTFELSPVAFKIPVINISVHWYGIIIALGLLLGLLFVTHVAKKQGLDADTITDMLLFAVPTAIIGARVYYVVFKWDDYKDNFADVFKIWEGGIAIYGAVIAAVITALVFFRVKKMNPLPYFDVCSLGLLIGQAIGRWGNFVNGEAHGGPTDWIVGMTINGSEAVHPTFLYESLWNVAGFFLLYALYRHRRADGIGFANYLIWYAAGRFFIEGLRTDSLYAGSFRISQIVALVSIVAGVVIYACVYFKNKKKGSLN
ncbi:MAG: prolipoprotein diacylglyceryl transferase [Clostridia bacterium]|nr:prolipoprotein diacylglyceryl transferase [Clostridia bacterium]